MEKEDIEKLNVKFEEKKFTYEDYTKITKDIVRDWSKGISRESFDKIQEYWKKITEYENKIDELALNYPLDMKNKKIYGYYEILEHCLRKIKENDVKYNEGIGFGCVSNLDEKEKKDDNS